MKALSMPTTRPDYTQLLDDSQYEVLAQFGLDELIPFVVACYRESSPVKTLYYIPLVLLCGVLGYQTALTGMTVLGSSVFLWLGAGVLFMLTVGAVLHELLHAAVYYLLGARRIHFGAEWRYYAFYAIADGFSVNWREYVFVALTPLVVLTAVPLILALLGTGGWSVAATAAAVMSMLMASGDVALLNGFWKDRHRGFWTCDAWQTSSSVFAVEGRDS